MSGEGREGGHDAEWVSKALRAVGPAHNGVRMRVKAVSGEGDGGDDV